VIGTFGVTMVMSQEYLPRHIGLASGLSIGFSIGLGGLAAVALGAGRARIEDAVDHAVGLVIHKKVGDLVEPGEPLCTIHHGARGAETPDAVAERVLRAYQIGQQRPPGEPLVLGRIG
jgi:thymidine phosphorylase